MEIISRTVKILDVLSANDGEMRFSDLAEEMNLPSPSTLTRLLKALCNAEVLYKDDRGWYCLGSKPRQWSNAAKPRLSLQEIVHPELENINRKFHVSTIVFRHEEGNMVICADKIADENSPSLQEPGAMLPLNLGILGSCFLEAEHPVPYEEFTARFSKLKDLDKLISRLHKDAENYGYIYDYGKLFPDNHRLAVPVKFEGKTVAVIGAGFTPGRVKENDFIAELADELKKSAHIIEKIIENQHGDF
jgi:DNA-binding IclR family transcriptional regulator